MKEIKKIMSDSYSVFLWRLMPRNQDSDGEFWS